MIENGYPVPDPDSPGKATILNDDAAKILSGNSKYCSNLTDKEKKFCFTFADPHRVCCRCGKQFTVDEDGFCTTYEECTFHWGRAYKRKGC